MENKNVMDEPDLVETKNYMHVAFNKIKNCTFRSIEEVDLENLRLFLIEALRGYKNRNIEEIDLLNIVDALETYIHRRYMNLYPGTLYPNFSLSNPLSIGLEAIDYIYNIISNIRLTNFIADKILDYLEAPLGKEEEAHRLMKNYLLTIKASWLSIGRV